MSGISVSLSEGLSKKIDSFGKPLKVEYEYTSAGWYEHGTTFGYYLPAGESSWKKVPLQRTYDHDAGVGTLAFEVPVPGKMAIADQDPISIPIFREVMQDVPLSTWHRYMNLNR